MIRNRQVAPGRVPFTWRKLVTAGAIAACASAVTASAVQPQGGPQSIQWSIGRDGSRIDSGKVQLTVESRWGANSRSSWSNDRPLSDLQGLSAAQLAGPESPVRFALVRDAGRLDCSGTAGRFAGRGSCSLTVDPRFASYLQQHGIALPTPHQAFSLTMSGAGRDLVDALEQSGFTRPDIDQLTAMGIHGATGAYIRELAGLGYRLSADDVVAFRIHGVQPAYIREMAAIGPALRHIGPSDLVSLHIHGVKPAFVREMAAIGPEFRNVTADDLVSMAIHGVRPEMARAYVELEGGRLDPDDVVSMAIHGVTADYLRQLAALGYRGFSADDLVSMSIHGVTPDYVRKLQQNGMARLSADQLVRLRLAGFVPK